MQLYITKLFLTAVSEISVTSGITNHARTHTHTQREGVGRRIVIVCLSRCVLSWESGSLMEKASTYSLILFISCFLVSFAPFFLHLQLTVCHTHTLHPSLLPNPLIYLPLPPFPPSLHPPLSFLLIHTVKQPQRAGGGRSQISLTLKGNTMDRV